MPKYVEPSFFSAAYVDARVTLGRQLDVGIGLIVTQQDVIARLVPVDQVVFERQRFLLVIDVMKSMSRAWNQRAGFDVGQALVEEVAADPGRRFFALPT